MGQKEKTAGERAYALSPAKDALAGPPVFKTGAIGRSGAFYQSTKST